MHEIAQVMTEMREGKEVVDALRNCKSLLTHYQSECEKVKGTAVRLIKSTELLGIEYLILYLITTGEYALKMAYQATRVYIQEYDSSVGAGLIAKSIPMLEDVVVFWRKIALIGTNTPNRGCTLKPSWFFYY